MSGHSARPFAHHHSGASSAIAAFFQLAIWRVRASSIPAETSSSPSTPSRRPRDTVPHQPPSPRRWAFQNVTIADGRSPRLSAARHPAAGPRSSHWAARDGWPLRVFDWPRRRARRAGRSCSRAGAATSSKSISRAFAHWHAQGWTITAFDWRGQGGSGRLTPEPHVGHVDDFALYIDDLRGILGGMGGRRAGPRVAIGHSMGGHLVLRAMVEGAITPDAAVLVAPMLGLHAPIGPGSAKRLARLLGGLGDRRARRGRATRAPAPVTRQALLTHDVASL